MSVLSFQHCSTAELRHDQTGATAVRANPKNRRWPFRFLASSSLSTSFSANLFAFAFRLRSFLSFGERRSENNTSPVSEKEIRPLSKSASNVAVSKRPFHLSRRSGSVDSRHGFICDARRTSLTAHPVTAHRLSHSLSRSRRK